ncbi:MULTISPECIES: hypothetical protein [Streptomyces]|uniref:Uncharacterized protein n=2 Tax=Streptomyces TaxID=1883 RepID=A0A3M8FBJ0_9ACTN|nr:MULTISPECIES: hypothetical protein [Streptomyces]KNE79228.1 hypothetical protein ADZ36_28825 [Streptomyces fradiae]OFA61696.1 hypothetical protein BEN35_00935 [Streptomyces fradiae]PQM24342.1 hypothetical protein Sfr7A_06085 [Streptomyces xinghaiensis]RKM97310.1 hypothetical protein SFRA_008775 [Streptomyces xinghaiensis]RNC75295.1 hypothetical protein DC095_005825 [Streptomyces xinghaiensis]
MAEHPAVTPAAAPAAGAERPASHRHPGMDEDRRGKPVREFRNTVVTAVAAGDTPRDRCR